MVNASASESLSYSGRLVNPNGSPVVGPVNLKVELAYSNSPTIIRCSQNFTNIILSNGVFHLKVNFDCGSPVTLSQVLSQIPANESAAIRVTNITDLANPKVYSFQALHSMPFANIAETAKQLVQMEATDGQVLKWDNATTRWKPGPAGGGGTVTSVSGTLPISVATGSSTAVISMPVANTSTSGYLSSADWNSFNSKEGTIAGGTALQYYRGDKSWQTLNTSVVPESGVTNLYFSNARVLGVPLDGFVAGPGVIAATDTVLQAFAKTQGQINSLTTDSAKYLIKNGTDSITGVVTVASPTGFLRLIDPPALFTDATNMAYVNSRDDLKVNKSGDTMSGVLTLDNDLKMKGGANYVTLKSHATSATYNLFLPQNAGTSGFVLSTDGNGNTTWINPASVANGTDTVTSASIVDGSIVDADINASAAIAQSKIANLSTDLAGKEPTVTNPSDTSKYYRGDKSWQTLNTTAVAEGSNLYFSNARVLGTDLLGLNTGVAGPIIAADTVLGAFGKLQYQVTDLKAKGQWEKSVNDIYYNIGNVGIGTTTPGAKLDVASGTVTADAPIFNGTQLWNSGATTFTAAKVNVTDLASAALSKLLDLQVGGVSKFSVDKTGKVYGDGSGLTGVVANAAGATRDIQVNTSGVIGVSENTFSMQASTVGNLNHLRIGGSGINWSNGTHLTLVSPATYSSDIQFFNSGSGEGASDGAMIRLSSNNLEMNVREVTGKMLFSTADTERMRISESGNVGIGTATPGAKLEVAGQVKITGGTPGLGKVLTSNAAGLATWETPAAGGITSLNGLVGTTQAFAIPGTAGTAPNWSSSGTDHTINIPMAATAGVTAGLISKTDYDAFNSKLGTTLNSGNIWVGNGSNAATAVTPTSDVSMTNAGAFTVTKLQGNSVSTNAPVLGSFLKWDNILSQWAPTPLATCSGANQVMHYILLTDTWSCDTLNIDNLLPTQTANSGKVLTTNGTTATWQTPAGVTGSGTTNYLPKFTAASTLGDSLIFDNGSKVGIGTNAPVNTLSVLAPYGSANNSGTGANGGFRLMNTTDAVVLDMGIGINTTAWLQARDPSNYATVKNMLLNPVGGHVTVGGSNVFVSLSTNSLAAANGVLGVVGNNTASASSFGVAVLANNRTTPASGDTAGELRFSMNNNAGWRDMALISSKADGTGGANGFGGSLILSTKADNINAAPYERMRITSNGNVGINTSTPEGKLVVSGGAGGNYGSSSAASYYPFNSGVPGNAFVEIINTANGYGSPGSFLGLKTTAMSGTPNQRAYIGIAANMGAANYTPNIVFGHQTGATAYQERLRIDASGNVGIGTTTPGAKLEVATGSVTVDAPIFNGTQMWMSGTTTFTAAKINITDISSAALSKLLDLQVGGVSKFSVDKTGKVTGDGSGLTGVTASPAGASGQIQFNNAGALGASANLFWDVTNSRLGIGTATPGTGTSLNVAGQIKTGSASITTGAVDWVTGNSTTTSFDCGSNITFANLRDGGSYTLVVTGTGTTQCTFSTTTTGDDAATVTYRFKPTNGVRTASSHTVYSLLRIGTIVYVSWISGF